MIGRVDEARRALIEIDIIKAPAQERVEITVWVDTAFDGFLVFPKAVIELLRLRQEAITQAVLADGNQVMLQSFHCEINWFGERVSAQVIANEGRLPLLGTELLDQRRLVIDYAARTLVIE